MSYVHVLVQPQNLISLKFYTMPVVNPSFEETKQPGLAVGHPSSAISPQEYTRLNDLSRSGIKNFPGGGGGGGHAPRPTLLILKSHTGLSLFKIHHRYSVTYRVICNAESDLWSIQHCLLQTLHCIRIPANLIQSLTELLN